MSGFLWNVNVLIFWRLAWLEKQPGKTTVSGWYNIGRLYFTTQSKPYKFYIQPKVKKLKNLIAKFCK